MPNIRQPQTQVFGVRGSEQGIMALSQAARRQEGIYGDIAQMQSSMRGIGKDLGNLGGEWVNYRGNRQISEGAATLAELQATHTQLWNEWTRDNDPNDPSTAARFQKDVLEPSLQKWRDGFDTDVSGKWADNNVARWRDHMFKKTQADMVALAGEAAAVNVRKMTNQLSVMVRKDPTSLDIALESLDDSIGATFRSSPTLAGAKDHHQKLTQAGKEALVKAAVMGAIERNPDAGLKMASDPRYSKYITGQEIGQFEREARTQIRLERAERRYQEAERKEQAQKVSEDTVKAMITNLYSDNPSLTIKDVVGARDRLTLSHYEHMIGVIERKTKPDPVARVSAETTAGLLERMWMSDGDPNKVTSLDPIRQAFIDGKMTRADFNFLNEQFDRAATPDGSRLSAAKRQLMDAVKPLFERPNGLVPITDPEGRLKMMMFMRNVDREIEDARKSGKNPVDILEKYSGPESMRLIQPWLTDLNTVLRTQAGRLTPTETKPQQPPAETKPIPTWAPEGSFYGPDGQLRVIRDGRTMIVKPRTPQ